VEPTSSVARPTAGALDDAAVNALAALGSTTILGDADTVARPPQPNEFTPPPTAALAVGAGTQNLVLPDAGTQALLGRFGFLDDPVRAAQAALGELATIWREQPVPSTARGVGISLPSGLPPRFWGAFLGRIAAAPFLRSISAQDLVARIPPPAAASELADPSTARFSPEYSQAIKRERRDLIAFRSMTVDGGSLGRLEFASARFTESDLVASSAAAVELLGRAIELARLGAAAELLGIMEESLAMTIAYLNLREQFGRKLASFQALQHRAASMYVDIEVCRSLIFEACRAGDALTAASAAAAAKLRATEASLRVTKDCIQLHGAIGFTDEHDIRILTEGGTQRFFETLGVQMHLPLVDQAFVAFINKFHRVFDRDDMVLPDLIDVINERRQGG